MDIRAAKEGIAQLLRDGFSADWTITDYVPDSPTPPALCVGIPAEVEYGLTMAGTGQVTLPIVVVLGAQDAASAQRKMDSILSARNPGSLYDVLAGKSGDAFSPIIVQRAENIARAQTVGGAQLFAADVVVSFMA